MLQSNYVPAPQLLKLNALELCWSTREANDCNEKPIQGPQQTVGPALRKERKPDGSEDLVQPKLRINKILKRNIYYNVRYDIIKF